MAVLFILALSIITCSIDRLPGILKIIKDPVNPLTKEQIEKLSIRKSILLIGNPEFVKDTVRTAFKKAGFNMKETRNNTGCQFYSHKGR